MTALRMRWLAAAGLAFVAVTAESRAQSSPIHFVGTTSGCFYTVGGCVPMATASIGGMTYDGTSVPQFDGWTDSYGFLGIGGQYDNLGMFSLTNDAFNYNGWNFLLRVVFSAPPGVSTTNAAWMQGRVSTTSGGATIHFDTAPQHLIAEDATEFDFTVNELSVSRGTSQGAGVNYISGDVQVTATPEPATVGLMVFGLAFVIPAYRRHRRNTA